MRWDHSCDRCDRCAETRVRGHRGRLAMHGVIVGRLQIRDAGVAEESNRSIFRHRPPSKLRVCWQTTKGSVLRREKNASRSVRSITCKMAASEDQDGVASSTTGPFHIGA